MEQITYLEPDQLHESPTNPRLSFDAAALSELAYSIAQQGIMQPIVVRPITQGKPHQFEVVFGHRRLRAAVLADLVTVPCIVRPMTDEDVALAQVHENLKRADVHPVEEALGYVRLMHDHEYSVARLCEKTGKTRAYIYARLKLSQLGKAAQEACLQGAIGPEIGVLVARYCRSAKLQARAIALVTTEEEDGDEVVRRPIPYRQAKQVLRDQFCIRLHAAPFDIADDALRPYVGACTGCSKMAGNDPELADSTDADVCTDRECYDAKIESHTHREISQAVGRGLERISAEDAAAMFRSRYNPEPDGHVVTGDTAFCLSADPGEDDGDEGDDEGSGLDVTFAQAMQHMGASAPRARVVAHPHRPGVVLEVLTHADAARVIVHGYPGGTMHTQWTYTLRSQLQAAQAQLGGTAASDTAPANSRSPERDTPAPFMAQWARELAARPPEERAVIDHESWRDVRRAILQRVRSAPRTADDLRLVLLREIAMADEWDGELIELMGWGDEPGADEATRDWCIAKVATLNADDLAAVLMLTVIGNDGFGGELRLQRLATAKRYGVDVLVVGGVAAAESGDDQAEDDDAPPERCPNTSDMFAAAA